MTCRENLAGTHGYHLSKKYFRSIQNHTGEVQRCAIGSLTFLKIWADWAAFQFIAVDRIRTGATKSEVI